MQAQTKATEPHQTRERQFSLHGNIVWTIVLCVMLGLLGMLLGRLMIVPLYYAGLLPQEVAAYSSDIGIWIVVLATILIFKKNRYIAKHVGYQSDSNNAKMLLVGLFAGAVMNGACGLAAYAMGNISLAATAFSPLVIVALFVAVAIQSSAEELLMRGFLYRRVERRYGSPLVALLVTSVVFALMHGLNPGITPLALVNLLLCGIVFGLMAGYLNSLWMAMACHAAWNFMQNVVLGLPNSGVPAKESVLFLDPAQASSGFAYDTAFGLEGSGMATVVLAVAAVVLYLAYRRSRQKASGMPVSDSQAEA